MEKVTVPRTMSPATALPTPNSRRAVSGESSVHTTQRSTLVVETGAKTNGKKSSQKEKYYIVNSNRNLNLGFMDVTKTIKNFEIHDENESSLNTLLSSKCHSHIDRTPWHPPPWALYIAISTVIAMA